MPTPPRFSFSQFADEVRALVEERDVTRLGTLSRLQRFVHFWMLVGRSFVRNRCPIRASALSFTSLLSLIPLLAVALGITGLFLRAEGEQRIDRIIDGIINVAVPPAALVTNRPAAGTPATTNGLAPPAGPTATPAATNAPADTGQLLAFTARARSKLAELTQDEGIVDARRTVARYINEFIQNTRSGALGATGMLFLLWMIYALLSRIEETMDDIWGAPRARNWLDRIRNYWLTVSLGPVIVAFGIGLASGPQSAGLRNFVASIPLGGLVFGLVPVVLLWLAFTLFYQMMPNTKVRFSAAAVGSLIGTAAWVGTNLLGSLYISRVVTNSKIYGSLGLVPVFMLGLYTSWLILLFGAQVAYAWQNRAAYLQEKLAENVNQRGREFIALRLMTFVSQRFQRGERPASIPEMSADLGIPSRLIQQVMQTLLAARLVVEVGGNEGGYAPARPLEQINAHHILTAMRATQGQELATRDEPARAEVYGEFARIQEAERVAASAVNMLALVHRAQARLELPTVERAGDPAPKTEEPHAVPALGGGAVVAPASVESGPGAPAPASLPSAETERESSPPPAARAQAPPAASATLRLKPIALAALEGPAERPARGSESPARGTPGVPEIPASASLLAAAQAGQAPAPEVRFTQPTDPGFPD